MNEYQTWHAELLRETRIFMNGSLLTSLVKFMLCKTVAVIKVGQGQEGSKVISFKDPHSCNMGKGGHNQMRNVICCFFLLFYVIFILVIKYLTHKAAFKQCMQ